MNDLDVIKTAQAWLMHYCDLANGLREEYRAMNRRRVMYYAGFVMAAIAWLVVLAEILIWYVNPGYYPMAQTLAGKVFLLAWLVFTIILLHAED